MKISQIIKSISASAVLLTSISSFAQRANPGRPGRDIPADSRNRINRPNEQRNIQQFSERFHSPGTFNNGNDRFPPRPRVTPQRPPVANYSPARHYPYQQNNFYGNNYNNRGNRYYYNGGYHPRPVYYRPFRAPSFGIRVNILPTGYYPVRYRHQNYYYCNGTFYQPYGGYYQTIAPPIGAVIMVLPSGAYYSNINNIGYYEYEGTYYQPYTSGGYRVAGVNGYLQSDLPSASDDDGDIISDESAGMASVQSAEIKTLPADFKTVTLNGIVYYVSPAGEYYTKTYDENGNVTYRLSASAAAGNK